MEFFISHLLFIIGFSLTPCLLRINNLCYYYFFGVSARRIPCRAIFVKSQSSAGSSPPQLCSTGRHRQANAAAAKNLRMVECFIEV